MVVGMKEVDKLCQKTRAPEHLADYEELKKLARRAVVKTKTAVMDASTRGWADHRKKIRHGQRTTPE